MSTDNETKPTPGAAEAKPMTREDARKRATKAEALARTLSERLPEGADRDKAMQAVKHFEKARERLEPKRETPEARSPEMKPAAQERNTAQAGGVSNAQADRDRLAQQRETAAAAAREQQTRKPAEPERKPAAPEKSRDRDHDRDRDRD